MTDESERPAPPPITDWGNVRINRPATAAPVEPTSFRPNVFAGLWMLSCAAGAVWFKARATGAADPEAWGEAGGTGLAVVFIAWALGWVAWRLSERSRALGSIVLSIVAVVALVSQVAQVAMQQRVTRQEQNDIQAAMRSANAGFAQAVDGQTDEARVPAIVAGQLVAFDALEKQLGASDDARRSRLVAVRAIVAQRLVVQSRYVLATNRMTAALGTDLALAKDPARLERARAEAVAFRAASDRYVADMKGLRAFVAAQVAGARFSPGGRDELLRGYDLAYGNHIGTLFDMVDANLAVAEKQLDYLGLLAQNRRHWTSDAHNNLTIDSDELLDKLQSRRMELEYAVMKAQRAMQAVELIEQSFQRDTAPAP
jgi:hypothetical protein